MNTPTLLRKTLAPFVIAGTLAGATGFSKDRAMAEEPKGINQFAAAKVETTKTERSLPELFKTTEKPSLKMTSEEIAKADLSSVDKIVGFAIENGFLETDSQIVRNNLLQIQETVKMANNKPDAPGAAQVFAKRLALLVKEGYLTEKQAGALLINTKIEPGITYHAVNQARELVRALDEFESTNKPENLRPVDRRNNNLPITRGYIADRLRTFVTGIEVASK